MKIEFTKIQGLGNDFIIIDNRKYQLSEEKISIIAKRLCTRRISIGADGLMLVDIPSSDADFRMRFYNADGSIGEMCGNGARCIARYAYVNDIAGKEMIFETTAGIVEAKIEEGRLVTVKLNNPEKIDLNVKVNIADKELDCTYIELGNPGLPHAVIEYKGLREANGKELLKIGRSIRYNNKFPKGANVNFYDVINDDTAYVKTYERGVEDFTLACGTGSASTAIALILNKVICKDKINIIVDGGEIIVKVVSYGDKINMLYISGDTNIVANGYILDEDMDKYL